MAHTHSNAMTSVTSIIRSVDILAYSIIHYLSLPVKYSAFDHGCNDSFLSFITFKARV